MSSNLIVLVALFNAAVSWGLENVVKPRNMFGWGDMSDERKLAYIAGISALSAVVAVALAATCALSVLGIDCVPPENALSTLVEVLAYFGIGAGSTQVAYPFFKRREDVHPGR